MISILLLHSVGINLNHPDRSKGCTKNPSSSLPRERKKNRCGRLERKKCKFSRDNCRRESRLGRVNWSRAARLVGSKGPKISTDGIFLHLSSAKLELEEGRFSRDLTRRVKSPLTLENVGGWKALFHPRGEDSRIRRDVSAEISLNGWITEKRARRQACNNRNRGSEYAKM